MGGDNDLFAHLRDACRTEWQAYVDHEFVRRLGDGSLPEAAFRHYLVQDYLFLIHFARAYGLAAFKAESLDEVREALASLKAIVEVEMGLHVEFCARWGLDQQALAGAPEASATMAYTRYVLERGLAGDLLDLRVALAPCMLGYAEIGARLAAEQPPTPGSTNPYAEWIEMYASEEFQQIAGRERAALDALLERRGGPGRMEGLRRTFEQATRLEIDFWQMGLDAA